MEKKWMFDIVANKRNSLDVDKFDYLHRDSISLGLLGGGFDNKRLIIHSRVIDNKICYNQKVYNDLASVFQTRYDLFKTAYHHKVSKSIDYMIVDCLYEANPVFHFE